jgi:hypothetical protein
MIHRYPMGIYPRILWITFDATPEELNTMFPTGDSKDVPFAELDRCTNACVDIVCDAENKGGLLIRFDGIENANMCEVAHEANHVADEVYRYIGATPDVTNNEPHSYLVGWVANCVEETLKEQEKQITGK